MVGGRARFKSPLPHETQRAAFLAPPSLLLTRTGGNLWGRENNPLRYYQAAGRCTKSSSQPAGRRAPSIACPQHLGLGDRLPLHREVLLLTKPDAGLDGPEADPGQERATSSSIRFHKVAQPDASRWPPKPGGKAVGHVSGTIRYAAFEGGGSIASNHGK